MKQFCAYIHCKPDLTPFYVGKGYIERAYDLRYSTRRHNKWHKNIVNKYGKDSIIIEVIFCQSEDEAFLREKLIIKALKFSGVELCNQTDGGEGRSGKGTPKSKEHCAKISAANLGKKMTEESRNKMSEARKGKAPWNKGKNWSEEHKQKLRGNKNALGCKRSDETKKKIGLANSIRLKGTKWSIARRESFNKLKAA